MILDIAFEINQVRKAHKTLKKWPRKSLRYQPTRVKPDIHNGEEVCGNNSQEDREKGSWELTSDEEDENGHSDVESGKDSC